ncbi:plasmid recombination protein [Acetobacter estunensis]|nr:plasmid recombination protein [Acetobacter estunensis]
MRRPQPPRVLYGLSPADVEREHNRRVEDARLATSTGPRRLRTNQHTLLTVVASFPATGKSDRWPQAVWQWLEDTIAWLLAQFGDALLSVVLHTDEGYPHLHAFALPTDPQMKARSLHPGARAKNEARQQGAAN